MSRLVFRSVAEKSICAVGGAGSRVQVCELPDQFMSFIDARFRFRGAGFGPAAQPLNFVVNTILECFLLFRLRMQELFFLLEKPAVVSVDPQDAVGIGAVEFRHGRGNVFQKVAVVADDDAGKARIFEDRLKPLDASKVQMIGRLVEQ